MNGDLLSMIGTAEQKLRRTRDKKTRAEILDLIQDTNFPAEQRLRGYLVIGRTPPPELLSESNISNALQIADRAALIPLLSRKLSTVYADEVMESISTYLLKYRSAKTDIIATGLARVAARWSASSNKIRISPSTSDRLIEIVELLARRVLSNEKNSAKRKTSAEKALKLLTRFAVIWGSQSSDFETMRRILNILALNGEYFEATFTRQADNDEFDKAVQDLWRSAFGRIEKLAEVGDTEKLQRLAESLRKFPAGSRRLECELERLQQIRARYSKSTQDVLARLTGFSESEASRGLDIPSDDPDALRIIQLASALVRSWSARGEGPKAAESFEELQVVLADFFGIELGGEVGSKEFFNPRVHELQVGEAPTGKVELIRPWVQISKAGTSRILLKALVASQT